MSSPSSPFNAPEWAFDLSSDDLTPLPPPVAEGARTASPESKETPPLEKMEAFSNQLSMRVVQKFWLNQIRHTEHADVGVTEEELQEKVGLQLTAHIAESLPQISRIVLQASNPRQAFEAVSEMLEKTAMRLTRLMYESLVRLKQIGIDELTGLPNRTIFNRNLRTAIERNHRLGEDFSIIFFDLDHFKEVNDSYGHRAGDIVLQEVSRRLKLRELDSLTRFGGEEFIIILPATPKEGACILAQRISKQIGEEPFDVTGKDGKPLQIKVSASIGVAEYEGCEKDPRGEAVQRKADVCLYILKGKSPDEDMITADRRGQIACENRVITADDLNHYRLKMGSARSSFPPPRAN